MRFNGIAAAVLIAALAGCGGLPLSTSFQLRKVDPATTNAEELRVAVDVPAGFRMRGAQVNLAMRDAAGTQTDALEFDLVRVPVTPGPPLPRAGAVQAYKISPDDVAAFDAFRARAAAGKAAGMTGSLGVQAHLCHVAAVMPDKAIVSVFIRTEETGRYLPVLRETNFVTALPSDTLPEAIVPCTQ